MSLADVFMDHFRERWCTAHSRRSCLECITTWVKHGPAIGGTLVRMLMFDWWLKKEDTK